jgi:upstream activation factor subunit UAF30
LTNTDGEQGTGEESDAEEGRRRREGQRTPAAVAPFGGTGGGGRPRPAGPGEVVSKAWDHIKANNLQNSENRREILADDRLRPVFGKDRVTMFDMNKHLTWHLK